MILHKTGPCIIPILLLAGCSSMVTYRTYDPPRPPDQVAALWVPINLEPLEVDGINTGQHFIPISDRFNIELLPGAHIFVVRYSGLAGGPSAEQEEMINSPPVTVALDAAPGHVYRLWYSREEIDLMFRKQLTNITIHVEDITGNPALIKKLNKGWQTSTVLLHKPNSNAAPTSVKPAAPPAVTAPSAPTASAQPAPSTPPTPVPAKTTPAGSNTTEQLKNWWQQADENERGEFLKWTVQQK